MSEATGETGLVTFVGVVHPWMCDVMGHMNVRHYAAMFDDATFQLLGHIAGKIPDASVGWADVCSKTEYKREILAGELLTIRSQILKIGHSSLNIQQVMSNSLDKETFAVNETKSIYFDKIERRSKGLSENMKERAEILLLYRLKT